MLNPYFLFLKSDRKPDNYKYKMEKWDYAVRPNFGRKKIVEMWDHWAVGRGARFTVSFFLTHRHKSGVDLFIPLRHNFSHSIFRLSVCWEKHVFQLNLQRYLDKYTTYNVVGRVVNQVFFYFLCLGSQLIFFCSSSLHSRKESVFIFAVNSLCSKFKKHNSQQRCVQMFSNRIRAALVHSIKRIFSLFFTSQ